MSDITNGNGWTKAEQKVIYQLDELQTKTEKLEQKIDKLREDVIILKMKAWAFGVIGGAVITFIFQVFTKLVAQ